MEFIPFYQSHDAIAARETRSVTLPEENEWNIPPGTYGLIDSYCIDDACDCRKAMIAIVEDSSQRVVATIGYGWESAAFYTAWMLGDNERGARMSGSYLELAQQSSHSNAWLAMWKDMIASDGEYRKRICRHYRLFKNQNV